MHIWLINDGFSLKGTWRSRSSPSRPSSLQRSGAVCVFALCYKFLTEMIGIYLSMRLKVIWHDNTARLEGRNKKLSKIVEKVPKMMRMEVVEKDVQLSITEGGKEGKSKAIASCRHILKTSVRNTINRKGVGIADSVETSRDDFEDEIKAAMSEREDEKEEVRCKILHCQEEARTEELYEDWRNEITEGGFGPSESEVKTSLGTSSTERLKLRRPMTQQKQVRKNPFNHPFFFRWTHY